MSEYINIRSKPSKWPNVPTNEIDYSAPSPNKINNDLQAAVIQMDSIETSKYKLKETEPRSPAPLPEAISPAGIPVEMNDSEAKEVDEELLSSNPESKKDFKINLGSYEVMNEVIDVTTDGSKPDEYTRNVKGSLVIVGLILISLHLISSHGTMFYWVINYESPDLIISTILYFVSSFSMLFLMVGMLVMPGLSINEEKFKSYYGIVLVAGGLDFVAVMLGGSVFSPLGFHTKNEYSYLTYYWIGLIECLLINGSIYYLFTRRPEDGKLHEIFHPFKVNLSKNEPQFISAEISETADSTV